MIKKISFILGLSIVISLIIIPPAMAVDDDLFILDEIVVTATRYPVEVSKTPVSMEVITEEKIQNSGAKSVAGLLNGIAGVRIINNGGLSGLKTVHIRGSESSQVLILFDGQPVNNCQNGQTDLGQLPLYNVKKVEILKGPASAIYGANALGGVINIFTEDISDGTQVEFKAGYGSYSTSNVELSYSSREEKTGVIFAFNKKSSSGFRKNPDNSGLEQLGFFTKVNYNVNSNNNILLTLNYNNSEKEVPGSLSLPSPSATQDDLDKNINIQWQQEKNAAETTVSLYNNTHELIYDNPDEWGYTGPSIHNTGKTGLELNRVNYLDKHTVFYGLEFKNNTVDSNENGKHEFLNKALYLHDKWQIKSPVKLTIGARYDNHEKFGSAISPRIGTVYEIDENTSIHLSAGKAYRTPTFNDLYWPASMYTEGNPDLKSETAIAYEVGIVNRKENMKTEVNIFNKDVDDLIEWAEGEDYVWRPYNVNKAVIRGTELIFEKLINENLSFDINYTYLDAKDKETDEQLKDKHNASMGIKFDKNDYFIKLNASYVDGRIKNLEGYTVVDARLSKVFNVNQRDIEVALSINNLLNNDDYQINKGYPLPGRNYMLSIGTKF